MGQIKLCSLDKVGSGESVLWKIQELWKETLIHLKYNHKNKSCFKDKCWLPATFTITDEFPNT